MIQLLIFSLSFWIIYFYKTLGGEETEYWNLPPPSEEALEELLDSAERLVSGGLGFDRERVLSLDYEGLEGAVSSQNGELLGIDDGGLMKAVAEAVARAGPWDASMNMVASLSGLSKSGLYAHFKNKRAMLRQLFFTEFGRILKYAEAGARSSAIEEEQVYLGIFSIANYLRTRPDILIAADWLRNRRLDLGSQEGPRIAHIFKGIDLTVQGVKVDFSSPVIDRYSHWVFFLIVNTLMRRPDGMDFADLPNSSIRTLYRFIALGLKGFCGD